MWVLRKNVDDLTEADLEMIKKIKPHTPDLVTAYSVMFDADPHF